MEQIRQQLSPMRLGLILALLTLAYGFGLGGAFGLVEDRIKDKLKHDAQLVLDSAYGSDEAAMKKVTDKSWVYLKRAHLHANGLGAAALAVLLLVAALCKSDRLRSLTAFCLGAGSLGYSLFWMLAGLRAPGLGSTGAAKESLAWLAMPTAGLCLVGLLLALLLVAAGLQGQHAADEEE